MYDVSDQTRALAALRGGGYRLLTTATFTDLTSGAQTSLPLTTGAVTDDVTGSVRRSLTCTLPPSAATWQILGGVGEVAVTQQIRYVFGVSGVIPLGVFRLSQDSLGFAAGDTLTISSAPDRWMQIQQAQLLPSQQSSVPTNAIWQEIQRLVEGAWNGSATFPGWSQLDQSATAPVGILTWSDGSREKAILELAQTANLEIFFDRGGMAVLRPIVTVDNTTTPVWTIDAGASGVMVKGTIARDRSKIANTLIVTSNAPDVSFAPVVVTYDLASDPLSTAGPFGVRATSWAAATFRDSDQAQTAGQTRLTALMQAATQDTAETPPCPLLDADDPVRFVPPAIDPSVPSMAVVRAVDSVSHPFTADTTSVVTLRSTLPPDAVS